MKIRYFVGAIGAAAMLATTPSLAADPVTVKIGSFTPPKAAYLQKIIIPFLRTVEKDSGGEIAFKEFWGGALIRSPRKQWEGVMNKIQDAAQVLPAYTPKLFPDFTIFALPYTFRNTGSAEAAVAIWRMHEQGHLGGLEKVHVFGVYTNDNSGMHLNRKISSLADIKGLKFRVPGKAEADVVKKLGGTPVGMSIRQVAESLNRGVIQGALAGWSALGTFRITPLIKSHIDIPLGVRTFILAVHKDVYNKLGSKARDALARHGGLKLSKAMGNYYEADGRRLRADPGERTVVRLSQKDHDRLYNDIFKAYHTEWIAKNKDGQRKYAALQAILKDLRAGQ